VKITAGAEMTSTATSFELTAWIEALEGAVVICRRDWQSSMPRTHM
jgi:hypothetical protein